MNAAKELADGIVAEAAELLVVAGAITDHIVVEACRVCRGSGEFPLPQISCYRCRGIGVVHHHDC